MSFEYKQTNNIKFVNEPVIIRETDGKEIPFISQKITNNREAYAASLNMIFKHIADFHITILEIVSDKFNLSIDEMLTEVHNDIRYKSMPNLFQSLGYFDNEKKEEVKQETHTHTDTKEIENMMNNVTIKENIVIPNPNTNTNTIPILKHSSGFINGETPSNTTNENKIRSMKIKQIKKKKVIKPKHVD